MFRASKLLGIMRPADVMDRSFLIFRNRYYPYMMINITTFGLPFVVTASLVFAGVLEFDFGGKWGLAYSPDLLYFLMIISVPSLVADIAMQNYTSALIRDQEIPWIMAVRDAFSLRALNHLLCRFTGWIPLSLAAGVSVFVNFIPGLGQIAWIFVVAAFNTLFVGLSPAIIVEENRFWFKALQRNLQLASKGFEVTGLSSGMWVLILMGFLVSFFLLFLSLGAMVAALVFGTDMYTFGDEFGLLQKFALNLMIFGGLVAVILIYMPLSSIFYSLSYYALRSKAEGFHLENSLNLQFRKQGETQAGQNKSTTA